MDGGRDEMWGLGAPSHSKPEGREGQIAGGRGFQSKGHVISWIVGRKSSMKGKLRQRENEWDERSQCMGKSSVRS